MCSGSTDQGDRDQFALFALDKKMAPTSRNVGLYTCFFRQIMRREQAGLCRPGRSARCTGHTKIEPPLPPPAAAPQASQIGVLEQDTGALSEMLADQSCRL